MRSRRTATAVLRAFRIPNFLIAATVPIIAAAWLDGPLQIPGRDIREVVVPLSPIALYFATRSSIRPMFYIDEVRHRHRHARRTVVALGALTITAAACLVAGSISGSIGAEPLIRNGLLYVGLALVTPSRHEAVTSVIVSVYSALAWMLGSAGGQREVADWAIPMLPGRSTLGIAVTASIVSAGLLLWSRGPEGA